MEEIAMGGHDRSDYVVKELLGRYDAPAYVRRALRVQQGYAELVQRCRLQRDRWLQMVRIRLGVLHGLAGEWHNLRAVLGDEQLEILRQMHAELDPRPRVPTAATQSERAWRRALAELRDSIRHFNRRWSQYLATVDLTDVNRLREDYNRYYLLEKECAVRSFRQAREGFRQLAPVTADDLLGELPLLPEVSPAG